jgi:magnesium transporter
VASWLTSPGDQALLCLGRAMRPPRRRKTHRGTKGKRKKDRRKSFAIHSGDMNEEEPAATGPHPSSLYPQDRNLSGTSLDSEALLDHR